MFREEVKESFHYRGRKHTSVRLDSPAKNDETQLNSFY